jgi:phytoene synthase
MAEPVLREKKPRWTLDEAYAYCEAVARAHYENFPVASRLVPRRMRPHVCSLYAFARAADDFADEAAYDGRRLQELDRWDAQLTRCVRGEADHPVFLALGETVRNLELPVRLLRDLLDAFRQDCRVRRYESWDDVLGYCRLSANPVGRLMLRLFGHADEHKDLLSDSICTALQLANFWQDVAVDLRKDRIYIPLEDLRCFGVTEADLAQGRMHDGLRALMHELVARTRRMFEDGRPLLLALQGRLGMEIRAVWLGGRRVLDRIETRGCDVFTSRPRLTRWDRTATITRALVGRWALP